MYGETHDYGAALNKARRASARFQVAQSVYRARKIGDKEFLAEKALYDASTAEFDAAYAAEQAKEQ